MYGVVDEAGVEGIWSRHIQDRLSINQAPFNTAVKHLLSKRLIVPFKSVEHPNRKMFIKASIQPSERAAGGVWHNANGELDEPFIEEVKRVIFDVIKDRSTVHGAPAVGAAESGRTRHPAKGTITGGAGLLGKAATTTTPPPRSAGCSATTSGRWRAGRRAGSTRRTAGRTRGSTPRATATPR